MEELTNNPFASPLTAADYNPNESEAEQIRRKHLSHEASIQSMGLLYLIGGIIGIIYCFAGVVVVIANLGGRLSVGRLGFVLAVVLSIVAMTCLNFWVGLGLRKLKPAVRIPAIVLSAIGLPIGTIISAYFLWLLLSAKGKYVFTPQYQEIIRETPHIKYKTSIIVWIFVGLLGFVILLGLFGAVVMAVGRATGH